MNNQNLFPQTKTHHNENDENDQNDRGVRHQTARIVQAKEHRNRLCLRGSELIMLELTLSSALCENRAEHLWRIRKSALTN